MVRITRINPHIVNNVDMRNIGVRNPGLSSMYNVLIGIMGLYCFSVMIYTANTVAKGAPQPWSGDRPPVVILVPIVLGLGLLFLTHNYLAGGAGYAQKLNYFRVRTAQLVWQYLWMAFTCGVSAVSIWKYYTEGCFSHTQTENSLCIGAPYSGPLCAGAGLGWILVVILHTYLHVTEQNYQLQQMRQQAELAAARRHELALAEAQSKRVSEVPQAHIPHGGIEQV